MNLLEKVLISPLKTTLGKIGSALFLNSFLARMKVGCLRVELPDGTVKEFGDLESELRGHLKINNENFFTSVLIHADIGFSEAFMYGDCDTDDLTKLIHLFLENREYLDNLDTSFAWAGHLFDYFGHTQSKNSEDNSINNIRSHYDLSNDVFQLFLDPTMTYSCAYFGSPDDSLETAQIKKINKMIQKARIRAEDHVLEIGCGWGGFAIQTVRQTGCRITAITLSVEQQTLARERVKAAGLEEKISIELIDYRKVEGQFDKIVSIEMLEAVGHEYLGNFFEVCDKLLKPNGLLVVQVITVPDFRYDKYRKSCDFIQKYIFRGGICPSLSALTNAMKSSSKFTVEQLENIGPHYAKTLRLWKDTFTANKEKVTSLGFDSVFFRKWIYYFCYCEAGFASRTLSDLQIIFTIPGNVSLPVE